MKVMIIGSGGRENAIAQAIAISSKVSKVFIVPGLKGMDTEGKISHKELDTKDHEGLIRFANDEGISFTIVGPEQALTEGIVDSFQENNLEIYGPSAKASELESSKIFAKKIMKLANVPTANYKAFENLESANLYIDQQNTEGFVIKKDGLAAGKGVAVCTSKEMAKESVHQFIKVDGCKKILIEELLEGKEISYFALCHDENYLTLGHAQDYKRIRDNDSGPNTGGMGAYAPVPWLSEKTEEIIKSDIIAPMLKEMKKQGIVFHGTLFIGLMITKQGPKVIEFNVRFGDPETQAILPLINEDFAVLIESVITGNFQSRSVNLSEKKSVHLVAAAYGYPGTEGLSVRKNDEVVTRLTKAPEQYLYYAGVKKEGNRLLTNGGRVLGVTACSESFHKARVMAYEMMNHICFEGMQYRKDIAKDL